MKDTWTPGTRTPDPWTPGTWTCPRCATLNEPAIAGKVVRFACRSCKSPHPCHVTPLPGKTWRYVLRSLNHKLYRGPFNSYAEAKEEARKALDEDEGEFFEAWVYESIEVPKRPRKSTGART